MVSLLDLAQKTDDVVDEVFTRFYMFGQTRFGDYQVINRSLPEDAQFYANCFHEGNPEYVVLENFPKPVIQHQRKAHIVVCRTSQFQHILTEFFALGEIGTLPNLLFKASARFHPEPREPENFELRRKVHFNKFEADDVFYLNAAHREYDVETRRLGNLRNNFQVRLKSREDAAKMPIDKIGEFCFNNAYLDWLNNELGFQK